MDSKKNCIMCKKNYNQVKRKPIILVQCSHQICEKCYKLKLQYEDDGSKICPICQVKSHENIPAQQPIPIQLHQANSKQKRNQNKGLSKLLKFPGKNIHKSRICEHKIDYHNCIICQKQISKPEEEKQKMLNSENETSCIKIVDKSDNVMKTLFNPQTIPSITHNDMLSTSSPQDLVKRAENNSDRVQDKQMSYSQLENQKLKDEELSNNQSQNLNINQQSSFFDDLHSSRVHSENQSKQISANKSLKSNKSEQSPYVQGSVNIKKPQVSQKIQEQNLTNISSQISISDHNIQIQLRVVEVENVAQLEDKASEDPTDDGKKNVQSITQKQDKKIEKQASSKDFFMNDFTDVGGKKYRLSRFLGKGSSGEVYRGERLQTFAIKKLEDQTHSLEDQGMKEILIMKHVQSEYLCELLDIYKDEEQKVCIVSEYAQHGDLRSYTKTQFKDKQIPENLAKEWLACAILGLRELHSRGIIHRDLKPDNILVFDENKVRIADYGLAKLFVDNNQDDLVLSQVLDGAKEFRSPEIVSGYNYNSSTDIYSLGMTFIIILTKNVPTIQQIQDPNWLPDIHGFSQEFLQILKKMVSYEKDERPNAIQIMYSSVFSNTEVMIDFKRRQGILALGFQNIPHNQLEKLIQQEVGCPNCQLLFCDKCITKKNESPFITLQSLLQHQQDINKKIAGSFAEALDEIKALQIVNSEVNTNPYQIVLDQVQAIVEINLRHENIFSKAIHNIEHLQEEIKNLNQDDINNAKLQLIKQSSRLIHNLGFYQEKEIQTDNLANELENLPQLQDPNLENVIIKPTELKEEQHKLIENNFFQQKVSLIVKELEEQKNQLQSLLSLKDTSQQNKQQQKPQKQRTHRSSNSMHISQNSSIQLKQVSKQNQQSFFNVKTPQSQSQSRNVSKLSDRRQSTSGIKINQNEFQSTQILYKSINGRKLSDVCQINNNNSIDKLNKNRVDQKRIQIIKDKNSLKSINISQNNSSKLQVKNTKNAILKKQFFVPINKINYQDNDMFGNRGLSFSLLNENNQENSLLDQALALEYNNLVGKEVNQHEDSFLKDYIPNWRNLKFESKYRATINGFSLIDLNLSLKQHISGQTLVFIQSEQGQVFGGYLSQPWPKSDGKAKDKNAFIFNLKKRSICKQFSQIEKRIQGNNEQINDTYAFEHNLHLLFAFGEDIRIFQNCDKDRNSYCNLGDTYALPDGMKEDSKNRDTYMAGEVRFIVKDIIIYALINKQLE
eukprot:403373965